MALFYELEKETEEEECPRLIAILRGDEIALETSREWKHCVRSEAEGEERGGA